MMELPVSPDVKSDQTPAFLNFAATTSTHNVYN